MQKSITPNQRSTTFSHAALAACGAGKSADEPQPSTHRGVLVAAVLVADQMEVTGG